MTVNKTPKMKRVLINFPPTYLDETKKAAAEMGLSLPELVRIAVAHWSVCEHGEEEFRRILANRIVGAA